MTDAVCGSCRYYAAGACYVNPPEPMMAQQGKEVWARPQVRPSDIGCHMFKEDQRNWQPLPIHEMA